MKIVANAVDGSDVGGISIVTYVGRKSGHNELLHRLLLCCLLLNSLLLNSLLLCQLLRRLLMYKHPLQQLLWMGPACIVYCCSICFCIACPNISFCICLSIPPFNSSSLPPPFNYPCCLLFRQFRHPNQLLKHPEFVVPNTAPFVTPRCYNSSGIDNRLWFLWWIIPLFPIPFTWQN